MIMENLSMQMLGKNCLLDACSTLAAKRSILRHINVQEYAPSRQILFSMIFTVCKKVLVLYHDKLFFLIRAVYCSRSTKI